MLLVVMSNRIFLNKMNSLLPCPRTVEAHAFLAQESAWGDSDKETDICGCICLGYEFPIDNATGNIVSRNGLSVGQLVQHVHDLWAETRKVKPDFKAAARLLHLQLQGRMHTFNTTK